MFSARACRDLEQLLVLAAEPKDLSCIFKTVRSPLSLAQKKKCISLCSDSHAICCSNIHLARSNPERTLNCNDDETEDNARRRENILGFSSLRSRESMQKQNKEAGCKQEKKTELG